MNQRRSFKNPAPIKGRDGKTKVASIHDGDRETFKVFGKLHIRYPRSDHLQALRNSKYRAFIRRLDLLASPPNSYLCRPDFQLKRDNPFNRHRLFALDKKGAAELESHGIAVGKLTTSNQPAHDVMISEVAASFHIAAIDNPGLKVITWADIIADESFPRSTRDATNPAAIPVDGTLLEADYEPFVLSANGRFLFFPGFEADCGTEPIRTKDAARSAIQNKYKKYLKVLHDRIHTAHFGARTFKALFITASETRMHSMIEAFRELEPGKYAQHFAWDWIPRFDAKEKPKSATGWAVTEEHYTINGKAHLMEV